MKNLLPIGSVVQLKSSNKRVLIHGRFQREKETNKSFDYVGCFYPEGTQDTSKAILFNQEDIKMIFFIGFQDVEEFLYREKVAELLAKDKK